MKKIKGFSIVPIIVILAVVAVVVGVIYLLGNGGLGFGGGKGDGEGNGDAETVPAMATMQDTEITTEIVTTQEIEYIEITVHENSYLYNNVSYEVEELENLINEIVGIESKFSIRVTDDNASSKAYSALLSILEDNNIRYIEVSE